MDIIEQLREWIRGSLVEGSPFGEHSAEMGERAAEEIVRAHSRIAELEAELAEARRPKTLYEQMGDAVARPIVPPMGP